MRMICAMSQVITLCR